MIPGYVGIGVLPMATIYEIDSSATVSHERLLLADADADFLFLGQVTPSGGNVLRVADRSYTTESGDTPASTPWSNRLLQPYNIEIRIPAPDAGEALGTLAFGLVEIEDADRELDALLEESWEGSEWQVDLIGTYNLGRFGEHVNAYGERVAPLLRATVDRVGWETGRLILTLREVHKELSQPVQPDTYGGTGGADGSEAIAGQRIPLGFGSVFNAAPTLVVPDTLLYQWHDGEVLAVDAVRDSGVPLTFHADFASFAALDAWVPTLPDDIGKYSTCLAEGYIKLAAQPVGLVTLDGRGDAPGGDYVDDTASIAKRIAIRAGLPDPSGFEGGSFGSFPNPGTVGYYTGGRELSALDAIVELVRGADGAVSTTRTGRLRLVPYLDPASTGEVATITDSQLGELQEETEIPPAWRIEVRYAPNWSPQDKDGLDGNVTAEDRELYSAAYRTAAAEDSSVKTTHKDARVHVVQSYLREKTDADALAAKLLARLKVRRRTFRATNVERQLFSRQPGDVARIVSGDCGLSAGKNLLVIGVAEVANERSNSWELWG